MNNTKARSFVTLMVVIAVTAFTLRFAIEQVIRTNITQNESNASATLKLIATALENFAKNNSGKFPESLALLTKTSPAYLDKDYVGLSPMKGYIYTCPKLDNSGYSCYASPTHCNLTGKKIYNITTGGLFVTEECSEKKE
jgi:hypothetical protein